MIPKFRAWHKIKRRMYWIDSIENMKSEVFQPLILGYPMNKGLRGISASISEFIIMQSIGFKDKNRKEIFEGDIVKDHSISGIGQIVYMDKIKTNHEYDIEDTLPAFLIKWSDDSGCSFITKDNGRIEVIGNIHKNPEMIINEK